MKFEVEPIIRLHDNGYYYEVGEDADGLGLVEIRYFEGNQVKSRVAFDPSGATQIAEAIAEIAKKMDKK